MHRGVVVAAVVLPLLSACHTSEDCAGVGRPAFEVTVLDARTGAPIADGAVIYVFELPSLRRVDSATTQAAQGRIWTEDRQGRFNVVVERPGYYPWTAEDRRVGGECSTETVFLTARLVPRGS